MTKAQDREILEAALMYAESGLAVFPCSATKQPLTTHGFEDATTDAAIVRQLWAQTDAPCIGCAVPEGVVVIDVDPRNGGDETMAELEDLPETWTVRTGSGGTHHWFATSEERLRGHLGRGVDVKRHGKGYVIMPPSVSSTGTYEVEVDADIAEVPEWLLALILRPERKPVEKATGQSSYGEAALREELETIAKAYEGERNDTLNRAAFSVAQLVAGGELDEDAARSQLEAAALDVGLEPDETRGTIESAFAAGFLEPRSAPELTRLQVARGKASRGHLGSRGAQNDAPEQLGERRWLDLSGEVPPPPPFVLWPIIPENAFVLVYGPAEASKSMVMAAIGAEASRRGIRSSYYSLENGEAIEHRRFARLGADPALVRVSCDYLDAGDELQVEELIDSERAWGSSFIVIDTYAHAYWSRAEDGNARAIEFARIVRHVMRETGISVVVLDHVGYMNDDEPRDASAKRQQVDTSCVMTRAERWMPGEPANFTMRSTKSSRFSNPYELRGKIIDTADDGMELRWDPQSKRELKWAEA